MLLTQTSKTTTLASIVTLIHELCQAAGCDDEVRPGPASTYPNSLFLTILVLKGLFGSNSERSFLRYLANHHTALLPRLPEQSWFNRKAKQLEPQSERLHHLLLTKLQVHHIRIRIIDATGIPVVTLHRARRCRLFKQRTEVGFGYCASKKTYYYGEKLTLTVTPEGIPTRIVLTPANHHDVRALKEHLPELAEDLHHKVVVGDAGYYDGALDCELRERYQARCVTPEKKRHQKKNNQWEKQQLRKRSIVETVIEQLQDHMRLTDTKARSHVGVVCRVQSTVTAFTFGIYLNTLLGRPPLAVKSLVM